MSIHLNLRSLAILIVITSSLFAAGGCNRGSEGSYSRADASNCLTDTKLVDQNGNNVSLASLKGKPMVVDFIYTTCPGPCLMETAKLTNAALRLGTDLGSKVTIVSISVDPEQDTPKQLLDYSRQQGGRREGMVFPDRKSQRRRSSASGLQDQSGDRTRRFSGPRGRYDADRT